MPTTTNRLSPSAPKKLQVTLLALRTSDGAPEMIQTRPPAVYSEIEMSTIEAIAESMALRLKQLRNLWLMRFQSTRWIWQQRLAGGWQQHLAGGISLKIFAQTF